MGWNGEVVDNNLFKQTKKLKLQTFSNLKSNVSIKLKDWEISLNSKNNIFVHLAVIIKIRQINLKDAFCYPFSIQDITNAVIVLNGMALNRKTKVTDITFFQLAKPIFQHVLNIDV